MKILILANNDVGLYQFRRELIEELKKKHSVILSLPYGEMVEPLVQLGCQFVDTLVDRRGVSVIKDLRLYLFYRRLLQKEKPELVLTYTIKPNVYGGYVCRRKGIPYAVNITGLGTAFQKDGFLKKLVTIMYRQGLNTAETVFFENVENQELFVKLGIIPKEKCYLLHGAGVNLERYQVMDYPKGTGTRFLFVGRVMREKGMDELLGVMKRLRDEGYECTLDVVGDFEEDYEEALRDGQDGGWLHYHGYQRDVRPFIARSHCFVLPSWHEGMANTNLECAASGRPVITSRIHGCMEAVVEGRTGFLCEKQNADSLYCVMRRFMELSYEEKTQMGLAGRRHMEENFDKRLVVAETIQRLGLTESQSV